MRSHRKASAIRSLTRHHGRHTASNRTPAHLPELLAARSSMQPACSSVCGRENPRPRDSLTDILSEHERAQEKLYLIWRAGLLEMTSNAAADWANSLARLQEEGAVDYFCWLMRVQPIVHW